MHPRSLRQHTSSLAVFLAGLIAAPAMLSAQQLDAPAVDIAKLLQELRAIRQQQTTQVQTHKQSAWQQISTAAGSNERATALWETAVRATQIEGAGKESAQLKAWKEGEGEAFKEREVQNAVRLHLQWLALTLQRSGGTPVKDLLPAVINYTRDLIADEIAMENLMADIKRERELGAANPKRAQKSRDGAATKRAHDSVMRGLNGSVVVQWMKLNDFLNTEGWELNPGNLDGIYTKIILPELRSNKDQRVFEYWDMKLKREADQASQSKLAFEIEKFNTLRRPVLLWNRSKEYVNLGLKNKAATEMFALIKAYPTHPDADEWLNALEQMLAPAPAAPAAAPAAEATGTTSIPARPPVPGL